MGYSFLDIVSGIPSRCQSGIEAGMLAGRASACPPHHAKPTATAFPVGGFPGVPGMGASTPGLSPTTGTGGKKLLKNPLQKPVCEKRDPRCADPKVYQAQTPLGQCCRENATKAFQNGLTPMAPTPALLQVSLHEWRGKALGSKFL
mmetsp:Transcript_43094/g.99238  ORF Transcript_43094/g.99238 Transcript_43094/m.99238 type:complete len:146 (+) Transcript_43094:100-537(+)